MKQTQSKQESQGRPSLDERLADNPGLAEAFHALIDEMDQSLNRGSSFDEVEEGVRAGVRKVGHEALSHWAQMAQDKASQNTPLQKPGAVKHAKKNFTGKPSSAMCKSRSRSGG